MRNVICILALLCTVYASEQDVTDPSRNLERLVNIQKETAEVILNNLLIFEKRMKQNLELKLNDLKADALLNIYNIINIAFEEVELSIKKGKEEGKKIDECYDYAKNNLETKNENANAELETCVQNGYTIMEAPLMNVAKNIEATTVLLNDLDAIIPSCYSSNFIKMQTCVTKRLFLSKSVLKRINNNAKEVTNTVLITYAKTIIDVRSCMTKPVANTRTFSTDIIVRTNSCVRNAPVNNPKPTILESI